MHYRRLYLMVAMRWIGALGLLGAAFGFARHFVHGGELGEIGSLLWGMLLLIAAVVMVAPEIIRLVASPLTAWIDGLYLPGGRPDPPQLSYKLVRYYQLTRQHEQARDQYRRILRDYPDEVEAYEGIVRLLVNEFRDRRAARRWLRRGLRRLRSRGDRMRLSELQRVIDQAAVSRRAGVFSSFLGG